VYILSEKALEKIGYNIKRHIAKSLFLKQRNRWVHESLQLALTFSPGLTLDCPVLGSQLPDPIP
jgi:hypothetical protein